MVAAVGLAGCKKDKHKASPTPTPTRRSRRRDQDNLWALAPEGAVSASYLAQGRRASSKAPRSSSNKLAAMAPEIAQYKAEFDKQLEEVLGTSNPTLANAGLSSTKGAAIFAGPDNQDSIVIVPLADRDKFVAVTKGTKGADGVDTVGKASCKSVKGVYACAKNVAMFDRLGTGKGVLRQQLDRHRRRARRHRGRGDVPASSRSSSVRSSRWIAAPASCAAPSRVCRPRS